MLTIGNKAPPFSLPSSEGREISLEEMRGKKLVLYFYPKDQTPGCTREACDFRDNLARLTRAGAAVLGVSKDSVDSHRRFRDVYSLPFPLLSDADNSIASAYGAYGTKMMYGKPVVGTIRSTFVIDEQGLVERIWSPVRVDGHVDAVLSHLAGEPQVGPRLAKTNGGKGDAPAGAVRVEEKRAQGTSDGKAKARGATKVASAKKASAQKESPKGGRAPKKGAAKTATKKAASKKAAPKVTARAKAPTKRAPTRAAKKAKKTR